MLNLNIQNWILYPLLRERGQMEFAVEIGSHLPHILLVWQRFEDVGTAGDSKQQLVLKAVLDSAVLCPEQQCINGETIFAAFCV